MRQDRRILGRSQVYLLLRGKEILIVVRLREDSEECTSARSLDTLAVSMPTLYQQVGTGQWYCPQGEAYAELLGRRRQHE